MEIVHQQRYCAATNNVANLGDNAVSN